MHALLAVLVATAGCSGSADAPASGSSGAAAGPTAMAPLSCEARVVQLEQRLQRVADAPPFSPPDGLELATSAAGESITAPGPPVSIFADGRLLFEREEIANARELGNRFEGIDRMHSILDPTGEPAPIFALADRRVTLARVRSTLDDHADRALLVIRDPAAREPPPCPESLAATCARLGGSDAHTRAAVIVEAWQRALGTCDDLHRMFRALANTDPSTRGRLMRRGLSEGLRACACERGLDVDAVEYLAIVTLADPFAPRLRTIALPPAAPGDATTTVESLVAR